MLTTQSLAAAINRLSLCVSAMDNASTTLSVDYNLTSISRIAVFRAVDKVAVLKVGIPIFCKL